MAVERRGAAIEIAGLRKEYAGAQGRVLALDHIDLRIAPGEFVCIVGPSGCGKSTLLRILANLRPPDDGSVRYAGRSAAGIGMRALARQVAYLAQGGDVHWPMRAEDVVALGRLPHRRPLQGLTLSDRNAIAQTKTDRNP